MRRRFKRWRLLLENGRTFVISAETNECAIGTQWGAIERSSHGLVCVSYFCFPNFFRRHFEGFLSNFFLILCVFMCVCVCVCLSSFFLLSFFFPPVVCLMIFSCCEWMTGSITANKLVPIVWVHRYSFVWFIATAAGDPLAWIGSSFLDPSRSIPIHPQ